MVLELQLHVPSLKRKYKITQTAVKSAIMEVSEKVS